MARGTAQYEPNSPPEASTRVRPYQGRDFVTFWKRTDSFRFIGHRAGNETNNETNKDIPANPYLTKRITKRNMMRKQTKYHVIHSDFAVNFTPTGYIVRFYKRNGKRNEIKRHSP